MRIVARHNSPPITYRDMDWSAIDEDTYDGAEDSQTRSQVGYGRSDATAIIDLLVNHLLVSG